MRNGEWIVAGKGTVIEEMIEQKLFDKGMFMQRLQ